MPLDRPPAAPLATWKDLCMDATDAPALAGFWGAVLGRTVVDRGDGGARLEGSGPGESVWVDPVPEPRTAKNRVHLDVRVGAVAALTGLGATVLREPGEDRTWHVLADPEGGEFCAFVRADRPPLPGSLFEVVVDARDAVAQARWWAEVLGGALGCADDAPWCWVEAVPGMPFESLVFVPVPEPKTAKNRVHWDVDAPAVEPLLAHGARLLRAPGGDVTWHVLADPEGNEFCVFLPSS